MNEPFPQNDLKDLNRQVGCNFERESELGTITVSQTVCIQRLLVTFGTIASSSTRYTPNTIYIIAPSKLLMVSIFDTPVHPLYSQHPPCEYARYILNMLYMTAPSKL